MIFLSFIQKIHQLLQSRRSIRCICSPFYWNEMVCCGTMPTIDIAKLVTNFSLRFWMETMSWKQRKKLYTRLYITPLDSTMSEITAQREYVHCLQLFSSLTQLLILPGPIDPTPFFFVAACGAMWVDNCILFLVMMSSNNGLFVAEEFSFGELPFSHSLISIY